MILYFLLHDIVSISILPDPHFVHDLSQPCGLRTDSTGPDLPSSNLTFKFFFSTKLIRPLTPTPQVFLDWRTWSKLEDMENEEKIQNMEKFFSSLTEVFWKTAQDWEVGGAGPKVRKEN